jgi:hypothetical protein
MKISEMNMWQTVKLDDDVYNTMEVFNRLVEIGCIEYCEKCGQYSAYSYRDVNMQDGGRLINDDGFADGGCEYSDDEILTNWPNVYSIGSAYSDGWTCGNPDCRIPWVKADSVYNNYGHSEE